MFQVKKRVAQGVDYFNKTVGKWWRNVDVDIIDINHPYQCVAGQVFNGWHRRPTELQNPNTTCELGLYPRHHLSMIGRVEVRMLTREWQRVIREMQSRDTQEEIAYEEDSVDLIGTHSDSEC